MSIEVEGGQQETPETSQGAIWTWPDGPGVWPRLRLFILVALSYAAGSQLALWLIEASELQGVLFIPSGITVGLLLRLKRRHWPIVLLAAGVAEYVMDLNGGFSSAEALGFALANVSEPLVGAFIVTATCGAVDLGRRRHVLWFTVGAVLAGPAVGAAIGAGADRIFGGDEFLRTFTQWWLGDALGVILVGSAILAWGSSRDRRSIFSVWGALLVVGSSALTVIVMTSTDLPVVFSVLIGVVIAGALFGVRAVAMTSLVIGLTIAVTLVIEPGELIVGLTPAAALVILKLQVGTFTLAGLLIAAESHERELATRRAIEEAAEKAAIERERQREHDLAIQVQRGLLPDRLVQAPGVEIAARYEAASSAFEVGGDWYDTVDLGEGRLALIVGDIVGHGIEAMTSMGRLRTALAALALHNDDPAKLLAAVDAFVGGPDGTEYATVFYAVVDRESGVIRYASAGHPPGLLISGGRRTWLDKGQSGPLNGDTTKPRVATEVPIEENSVLVLFSDGLVERRGESLTVGLARLEGVVSGLTDRTAAEICDIVFDTLVGTNRDDDTAILTYKSTPVVPGAFHRSFLARPEELRSIREALRTWMEDSAIPSSLRDDLLISVGEAATNAVRHAYAGRIAGDIDLRITPDGGDLHVRVADRGTWKEPKDQGDTGGLGTGLIRSLAREVAIQSSDTGTVVTFLIPLPDLSGDSPAKRLSDFP